MRREYPLSFFSFPLQLALSLTWYYVLSLWPRQENITHLPPLTRQLYRIRILPPRTMHGVRYSAGGGV